MVQTKKSHPKNTKEKEHSENNEIELKDNQELNEKKIVDPDLILESTPIEEKVDEDSENSSLVDESDENSDELSFDDEELNPFGDKWEQ